MNSKTYEISLEIAGPTAIWTRPDTGDSPGTYPVPTRSAAKGIFEAILWNPAVEIVPSRVEICAPLVYHHYATNYGGPLRKSGQIKDGNNYQLFATVLVNVRYRLYANLNLASRSDFPPKIRQWLERTRSPCHAFKDIFERRLKRGQCHYVPSLGWREFVPSYVGEPQGTPTQTDINLSLSSMPDQMFSKPAYGEHALTYAQGLVIESGVLDYGARHAE
jgi:CRISPR-associated protein Cas5d